LFYLQNLKRAWVDRKRIDEGNKKKINLEQLGRGLPRFDTIFASKINIILEYANEIVLSKSLVTILCEDPVMLEGDPIVLAKDQKDSTLLEKNSLFLTYTQIEALEF